MKKIRLKEILLYAMVIIVFIAVVIILITGMDFHIPPKDAIKLEQGIYTAGVDFPAGMYNIIFEDNNSLVEAVVNKPNEELYIYENFILDNEKHKQKYENINLEKGTTIEAIYCSVFVTDYETGKVRYNKSVANINQINNYIYLEPVDIYDEDLEHRNSKAITGFELGEGEYQIGKDVTKGCYDITLIENKCKDKTFPEIEIIYYDNILDREMYVDGFNLSEISKFTNSYKRFELEGDYTLRIKGGTFKFTPSN